MIEFQKVSKSYAGSHKQADLLALNEVSFRVEPGIIFGVIGESGAGKTTLLRCLNGLEKPDQGNVFIDKQNLSQAKGKALRELRQDIGCVFQGFNLLSSYDVFENIALPLRLRGQKPSEIKRRVEELLSLTGLQEKQYAYPAQLSGGQKQRVAIARALASKPKVLLLDEPTSALDPQTTGRILNLIQDLNQKLKITILVISHSMQTIRSICHQAALIEKGAITACSPIDEFFSTSLRVKHFLRDHDLKKLEASS